MSAGWINTGWITTGWVNTRLPGAGRRARSLVTALAVVAATAGLSGCGGGVEKAPDIAAIDVAPENVVRAVFTDGVDTAEIKRVDGDWLPGKGGSVESIALLTNAEELLFPVNAYRTIDTVKDRVNPDDQNYGLDSPAPWSMDVWDTAGKKWHLSVGKPTFNQAGYYAKVDGDPRIFLIISKTVSDIISVARGQIFQFEPIDKIKFVDSYFKKASLEGTGENETPDYDPWLKQVLAARTGDMEKLHKAAQESSSILGPEDKGKLLGKDAPDGPLVDSTGDLSRSAVAPGAPQ